MGNLGSIREIPDGTRSNDTNGAFSNDGQHSLEAVGRFTSFDGAGVPLSSSSSPTEVANAASRRVVVPKLNFQSILGASTSPSLEGARSADPRMEAASAAF